MLILFKDQLNIFALICTKENVDKEINIACDFFYYYESWYIEALVYYCVMFFLQPRPEIAHVFQVPEPRPSAFVTTVFVVLCLLPLLLLLLLVSPGPSICLISIISAVED